MLISYDDFKRKLDEKIKCDDDFYYELLTTVIDNPERYTGIFRISNVKTKLIQNVTQSREIKFGDFMEEIVTEYLGLIGCENQEKDIRDDKGNVLKTDQYFIYDDTVFLIEQKIRDDHDSSKKDGQYDNFQKKYALLKRLHPDKPINATMWFVDNSLTKNKKYYEDRIDKENLADIRISIKYGEELFNDIIKRPDVWEEICDHLERNKKERSREELKIPDFDTDDEIYRALVRLKKEKPRTFSSLIGETKVGQRPKYVQLRKELFPTERNFKRIPEDKKKK